tara:strand:- start:5 stop:373 length:369 start_codon:yes stop_codon:yes gene_type:complete
MIKYLAIPLILVGCTAPVTDPPAHACSPRLDGEPTFCPPFDGDLPPKPTLPREEMRGDIDIWNPHHFIQMEQMFIRNARRTQMENNMTQPEDAINKALMEFNYGSNGSTQSEELLQLSSDGD